jgi:hypothetical protein
MLNIKEFKSSVQKYDLERPNLFAVEFTYPEALKDMDGRNIVETVENGKLVTLFCKNANLPGVNLAVVDNYRYGLGPNVKMPVRGALNDISLTFLSDASGRLYTFFQMWLGYIYPQWGKETLRPFSVQDNDTYILSYKKNYHTEAKIILYNGEPGKTSGGILQTIASVASAAAGVPFIGSLLGSRAGPEHNLVKTRTYKIGSMYPTSISDISLSSSATDSVSEFTVTFTYRTFAVDVNY